MGALSNSAILFVLPTLFYLKLCRPGGNANDSSAPAPIVLGDGSGGVIGRSRSASDERCASYLPHSTPLTWSTLPWRFALGPIIVIVVGGIASIVGVYFVIKEMVDG